MHFGIGRSSLASNKVRDSAKSYSCQETEAKLIEISSNGIGTQIPMTCTENGKANEFTLPDGKFCLQGNDTQTFKINLKILAKGRTKQITIKIAYEFINTNLNPSHRENKTKQYKTRYSYQPITSGL